MMIAHGIDLVDIPSTTRLLDDPTDQFLNRCFTAQEQASVANGGDRAARLSGRFAVKEAVMKALGTGFGEGVGFLDVYPSAVGREPGQRCMKSDRRWSRSSSM